MSLDVLHNILLIVKGKALPNALSNEANASLQEKVISTITEMIKRRETSKELISAQISDADVLEVLQTVLHIVENDTKVLKTRLQDNQYYHALYNLIHSEIIKGLQLIESETIPTLNKDSIKTEYDTDGEEEEEDEEYLFEAIEYDPKWDEGDSDYEPEVNQKRNRPKFTSRKVRVCKNNQKTNQRYICKCNICKAKVTNVTDAAEPFKTRVFACENCDVEFTNRTSLKNHIRIHNDDKLPQPVIIPVKKSNNSKKRAYNKIKKANKQRENRKDAPRKYCCHLCNAAYKEKQHLDVHILVHKGIKPHECIVCGIRFTQKGHLTIHMRSHTGERPFKCSECKRQFVRNTHLIGHVRRMHLKIPDK